MSFGNKKRDRKLSKCEIDAIIKFIIENPDFEKPTKEIFYNKLIQETKIIKTWRAVHSKVQSMRRKYLHAKRWRIRACRHLTANVEHLKKTRNKVKTMCPYFVELNFIFGKNDNEIIQVLPEIEFSLNSLEKNISSNEFYDDFSSVTSNSDSSEISLDSADGETDSESKNFLNEEINGKSCNAEEMKNLELTGSHFLFKSLAKMKQLIFLRANNMQKRERLHKLKMQSYKRRENKNLRVLEENLLSKLNWEKCEYELRKKEIQWKENSSKNKIKNKYGINDGNRNRFNFDKSFLKHLFDQF